MVKKGDSTRLEDIAVDGAGASIKGSVELDQNGDLVNVNFPTYSPSEGDKTSIKAERGTDGTQVTRWIHVGAAADRPAFAEGYEDMMSASSTSAGHGGR